MRGIEALRRRHVPFHVICVVTADALNSADAIMDFFATIGAREVGFNMDEQEGARLHSTLAARDASASMAHFMTRVLRRAEEPGMPKLRERRTIELAMLNPAFDTSEGNDENEPFHIVTVLWDGRVSTFSPELAGLSHTLLGELTFGNVLYNSLPSVLASERFRRVASDIADGVEACREKCAYFRLCRGGAPANKLAELDELAGTETQHCRLTHQVIADVILTDIRTKQRKSMS